MTVNTSTLRLHFRYVVRATASTGDHAVRAIHSFIHTNSNVLWRVVICNARRSKTELQLSPDKKCMLYVCICIYSQKSPLNASTEVMSGNDAVPFTMYTSMNSAHVHMNERDGEITASQAYTTNCTHPLRTSVYGPYIWSEQLSGFSIRLPSSRLCKSSLLGVVAYG